ncbi:hypothetical protein [uncultured Clostridium sp.]|nr:hypothetical protein [uncultured Clostridium sp.]
MTRVKALSEGCTKDMPGMAYLCPTWQGWRRDRKNKYKRRNNAGGRV